MHAHNDPLESVAEIGLIGAGLWLTAGVLWLRPLPGSRGARHTLPRAARIPLAIGHVVAGFVWAAFHLIIITLQAFVFMMLTLVYVGQAHDAH